MKHSKFMVMLMPYMLAMSGDNSPFDWDYDNSINQDKKCLTKNCHNKRDGNHLYCSIECRKLHLAGKIKHNPAIFPQLSQEKINSDLSSMDYKDNPNRLTPNKLFKEKFGYEIIYWQNNIIIHD